MSRARDLSRLSSPTNFTADGTTNRVGLGSENPTAKLNVAGIVSATAFYGDGSNLEGVASAGLGTALGENNPLDVIYYTNNILNVNDNTTITVPTGSDTAYTQYAEVVVADSKDLIIADGDNFIPDVLGISTEGIASISGTGGRVRADFYTNHAGTGAPTFQTGVVVTGVATATRLVVEGTTALTNQNQTVLIRDSVADDAVGRGGNIGFGAYVNGTMRTLAGIGALKSNSGNSFNGDLSLYTRENGEANLYERLRITSAGNFGFGLTNPEIHGKFAVKGGYAATGNSSIAAITSDDAQGRKADVSFYSTFEGSADNGVRRTADIIAGYNGGVWGNEYLAFNVGNNGSANDSRVVTDEKVRIDSAGRLLVGTSNGVNSSSGVNSTFQVHSTNGPAMFGRFANDATASALYLIKSRNTTVGSQTIINNGDNIGRIAFEASDGSQLRRAATVDAFVDGTPGSADMPGRLVFSTTADGASSPTERMRIKNDGVININTTNNNPPANSVIGTAFRVDGSINTATSGTKALTIGLNASDGTLIEFRQAGTAEGSITVSGSTVSYNGGHLSRWSQLASGGERTEILRGSVLSNLDEMCEWGEEDNEQLNRMKVSDVEGDRNVAGVFQDWDDDDDTYVNDFYCAMTGDFVIRIAQGTTVVRGDLLMSAGDGTAKPQDDDIIRSKTIAKVTSTTVSKTYSDNSYCVPCVLMAC
jgi:hypothetical protein